MNFRQLTIPGVWLVELTPSTDERGHFVRTWCREEFSQHGLNCAISQCSTSFNKKRGTLRGMHWQDKPFQEAKVVQCVRGSIWDVVLDVRDGSPSQGRWQAVELSGNCGCVLYIPEGVAHGFQTLEDETEVHYMITTPYAPAVARGIRFDDPKFAIDWPIATPIVSRRDLAFPLT